ncbi:hypothetical protein [Sphingobium sp. TCM1]|uniref:hypothetical protein n=1 Tax=Sphingobium sp. TCM1 TaxID=453246 RepID=UPI0007F32FEB|nr:hypothetical protein [Sphingobium sp. TCM1]OAN54813.1 hypothetical protein A7Q26_22960 [Sphingobium sp. TCM1]
MIRSVLGPSALTVSALMAAFVAGASPGHAQEAQADTFVTMEEISVPIIDASRVEGVLRVSIILQARDAEGAAGLARRMPELRAAGLGAAIEFARLHASPFTPVDVRKLSAQLTPALISVDAGIARVLIVKVSALAA